MGQFEPSITEPKWMDLHPDSMRPFEDIPEVGYPSRGDSALMILSEVGRGMFGEIIASIDDFSWTLQGQPDHVRRPNPAGNLSEHTVASILSAGIRIGVARERIRSGYDESGSARDELLDRLKHVATCVDLSYQGLSWRALATLKRHDDGAPLGGTLDYWGATQEEAVEAVEAAYERWNHQPPSMT